MWGTHMVYTKCFKMKGNVVMHVYTRAKFRAVTKKNIFMMFFSP